MPLLLGVVAVITVSYGLFVLSLLAPPDVLLASGLTLENLFHSLLGSEELSFIYYHFRRTILVRIILGFAPLGYFTCLYFTASQLPLYMLEFGLAFSLTFAAGVLGHVYMVWYAGGTYQGHPCAKQLQFLLQAIKARPINPDRFESREAALLRSYSDWRQLALSIDNECHLHEKFSGFAGRGLISSWPGRRLIVTKSWILISRRDSLTVVFQFFHQLAGIVVGTHTLVDTRTDPLTGQPAGDGSDLQNMATVRIVNVESGAFLVSFSLPAGELDELRTYLRFPLTIADGVVIEPGIVQQFLSAFIQAVEENTSASLQHEIELEVCIGCMTQMSNVCLRRSCFSSSESSTLDQQLQEPVSCGDCRCRPMWCVSCLGRWFASRVTETNVPTSEWLSARVPCPTCRVKFCVRDVAILK